MPPAPALSPGPHLKELEHFVDVPLAFNGQGLQDGFNLFGHPLFLGARFS